VSEVKDRLGPAQTREASGDGQWANRAEPGTREIRKRDEVVEPTATYGTYALLLATLLPGKVHGLLTQRIQRVPHGFSR
jgi:hypothetical protein